MLFDLHDPINGIKGTMYLSSPFSVSGSGTANVLGLNINSSTLEVNSSGELNVINGGGSGGSSVNVSALKAQQTISGGGRVIWNGSSLKWTQRVILLPLENTEISTSGFFNIDCPTSGTITFYSSSGTTTVSCDGNGIPIGVWQGLYYEISVGSSYNSQQTRFRLVDYGNSTWQPDENWILIAMRNGDGSNDNNDTQCIKWLPGQVNIPIDFGAIEYSSRTGSMTRIYVSDDRQIDRNAGIFWNEGLSYGIYRTSGGWSSPNYQQLLMRFDTGIILDPGSSHGKSYVDVQGAGLRISDPNYGRLSIGISNPSQYLQVQRNHGSISDSGGENNFGLTDMVYFYSTGDGDILRVKSNTTRSDTSLFRCCNSSQNDVFKVCANGNVGIGVHNPSQKLHVQGHIYTSETIEIEGGTATWKYNSSTQQSSLEKTYITFKPLTTANDWVYLRQIGGDNAISLSYDFHDDNNDLRMYFRNVISAGSSSDQFINNFYFYGGSSGSYLYMMNKNAIRSTDNWLRLNQDGHYSDGVFTPYQFRIDDRINFYDKWYITRNTGNDRFEFVYKSGSTWYSRGYLSPSSDVSQIDFTGQHRSACDSNLLDTVSSNIDYYQGLIVSTTGYYQSINSSNVELSSNIAIDEALPIVELCSIEKDKSVYGVISSIENGSREYTQGIFNTVIEQTDGNRLIINGVGEGGIWITDYGCSNLIENGDYIHSSPIAGYGMKQDSEFLANYTVAKITTNVDFIDDSSPFYYENFKNRTETYSNVDYKCVFVGCTYVSG